MKLITYCDAQSQEHVGVLKDSETFIDTGYHSMLDLIHDQEKALPRCQTLLEDPKSKAQPLSQVKLMAPVPRPTSMRDGYAFRQHVESARKGRGLPMIPEFDLFPVFYFTNHQAVSGPGEIQVQDQALQDFDFELEVAVVIGKRGKNIPASKADEHIFGYMIMNDWSARALQREEMKLNLGPAKGKDLSTSLGPWLVTRDELERFAAKSPQGTRHKLRMRAYHNGKQVSDGNLNDMNWTFAQILERASYGVWLEPGDVIGSGTVGTGCYMELNATKTTDNVWIKPGDTFALEVEALGTLENKIVRAEAAYQT